MLSQTYTIEDLNKVACNIIAKTKHKTLAFYAPMGAGKTTLIKEIVKEIGSTDTVSSPTFGLVNEYLKKNGELLGYHFDFYRVQDEREVLDMGFEDYLSTNAWIFMEWTENIPRLLPTDVQTIKIEIMDETTRKLILL